MKHYAVEKLTTAKLRCGEGPVWDATQAKLFYTESSGRAIYAFDPASGRSTVISRAVAAASLCLHTDGLLAGGADGFGHLGEGGSVRRFTPRTEGGLAVDRLNDMIADPQGRVFAGQNTYDPRGGYQPGYLFCVDTAGARVCAEGVHQGNGMDFSPDLKTFYFTDTILRSVDRFDYDPATGALQHRRPFVRFAAEEGLPDGLAVDADGHVWIALFYGAGLCRFDPDGVLERRIPLPVSQPTSLAFGGADWDEIYVTSESTFTPGDLVPAGLDRRLPRGGGLYRIRQEIRGKPPFRAKI